MTSYIELHTKAIYDPDLITVLCPTRSRPEMLKQTIFSFDKLAIQSEKVDFWLLIDEDDTETLALIDGGELDGIGIKLSYHVGERPITLADGLNKLWQVSSNGGIYVYMSDHYQMLTDGWDAELRDTFNLGPEDRCQVVQIEDTLRGSDDLILWALSAEWVNIVGRFVPPYFPYWFIDMWIDHVAKMLDRKVGNSIFVKPINQGPVGTTRLWHLGYWYRFFQLLLFERMSEVETILHRIHGEDLIGYEKSKVNVESHLQQYEKWAASRIDENKIAQIESEHSREKSEPSELYMNAFKSAHQYFLEAQPQFEQFTQKRQGGGNAP